MQAGDDGPKRGAGRDLDRLQAAFGRQRPIEPAQPMPRIGAPSEDGQHEDQRKAGEQAFHGGSPEVFDRGRASSQL